MSYQTQRYLAISLTVAIAGLTLVSSADQTVLGISPRGSAWLSILVGVLGVALGFLPNVRGRSLDPEFLADRIEDLPAAERQQLATTMAARAERANRRSSHEEKGHGLAH